MKWLEDLQSQRDDVVTARNRVSRQLAELERAAAALTEQRKAYDLEIYALDCAINPEDIENRGYKRGFDEADQLGRQAIMEREKDALRAVAENDQFEADKALYSRVSVSDLQASLDKLRGVTS